MLNEMGRKFAMHVEQIKYSRLLLRDVVSQIGGVLQADIFLEWRGQETKLGQKAYNILYRYGHFRPGFGDDLTMRLASKDEPQVEKPIEELFLKATEPRSSLIDEGFVVKFHLVDNLQERYHYSFIARDSISIVMTLDIPGKGERRVELFTFYARSVKNWLGQKATTEQLELADTVLSSLRDAYELDTWNDI